MRATCAASGRPSRPAANISPAAPALRVARQRNDPQPHRKNEGRERREREQRSRRHEQHRAHAPIRAGARPGTDRQQRRGNAPDRAEPNRERRPRARRSDRAPGATSANALAPGRLSESPRSKRDQAGHETRVLLARAADRGRAARAAPPRSGFAAPDRRAPTRRGLPARASAREKPASPAPRAPPARPPSRPATAARMRRKVRASSIRRCVRRRHRRRSVSAGVGDSRITGITGVIGVRIGRTAGVRARIAGCVLEAARRDDRCKRLFDDRRGSAARCTARRTPDRRSSHARRSRAPQGLSRLPMSMHA